MNLIPTLKFGGWFLRPLQFSLVSTIQKQFPAVHCSTKILNEIQNKFPDDYKSNDIPDDDYLIEQLNSKPWL